MDTIYECLCLAARTLCRSLTNAFAAGCNKFSDSAVGKEHELLDQPVSLLGNLLVNVHRTSLLVYLNLHLRTIKTDGTRCKSLLAKLGRKAVQDEDSVSDLGRNALVGHARTCLNDHLSIFVCKTEIRIYCCLAEPLGNDTTERSDLEYS